MKKELHLAHNIQELNKIAEKNFKGIKARKLCNSAEKVFESALAKYHEGDEEIAYILLARFRALYTFLERQKNDDGYIKIRLGNENKTVCDLIEKLTSSLESRYNDQSIIDSPPPPISQAEPQEETLSLRYPNGYLTCSDLYSLIQKKQDMVLLDARPAADFRKSSMKHSLCVNIPEEIIRSGLSANTLGKQVPEDSLSQWERRWKAPLIILMDWSSTKDNIHASKLSILNDILVNWDPNININNQPVVLNGGYLEWLQMYPMWCTNPDVVHQVQNFSLNDLLDIDSINYPTPEDATFTRDFKPSNTPEVNRATKPVYVDENMVSLQKNIINKEKELIHDLLEVEQNLEELRNKRHLEAEEGMRIELQNREEKLLEENLILEQRKLDLLVENEELRNKLKNFTNQDLSSQTETVIENPPNGDYNLRSKLLSEAREKKKPSSSYSESNVAKTELKKFVEPSRHNSYPTVDRKSKPIIIKQGNVTEPGVTGLFNFSTTCYLNSIIQCLSNTKKLAIYFLSGDYKKDLDASAQTCGKIANSFGNLLQSLWSGENKSVCPKVLRSLICEYAPKYDNKLHHDAHEFLINLRVWLHDELKKPIFRPMQVIWTPKESMWVEQTNGMQSIMLATFAGQMRNNICCDVCQKRKDKYENFQDLSLALPPGESCTLQQCLDNYFSREPIIGYGCPRCRHDKAVYQQMSPATLPSVLVLVLKRFSEEYANNTIYFKKNCIAVNYPLDLKIFQGQYSLYGVVNHVGTLNEGHYTAICKNMKSNKWYLYDDTVVKEVDCNLTLNPVNVYIMFYQLEGEVDQPQILFK